MCCLAHRGSTGGFLLLQIFRDVFFAPRDLHWQAAYCICEPSFLIHHGGYHNLFVCP